MLRWNKDDFGGFQVFSKKIYNIVIILWEKFHPGIQSSRNFFLKINLFFSLFLRWASTSKKLFPTKYFRFRISFFRFRNTYFRIRNNLIKSANFSGFSRLRNFPILSNDKKKLSKLRFFHLTPVEKCCVYPT